MSCQPKARVANYTFGFDAFPLTLVTSHVSLGILSKGGGTQQRPRVEKKIHIFKLFFLQFCVGGEIDAGAPHSRRGFQSLETGVAGGCGEPNSGPPQSHLSNSRKLIFLTVISGVT